MLTWPTSLRIFVCCEATDLRCSFDRLAGLARQVFGADPLSGHLFVFFNRAADRVKILFWDRSGLCLFYKRLERGTFRRPAASGELAGADLTLILEGIDLAGAKRRPRFEPAR